MSVPVDDENPSHETSSAALPARSGRLRRWVRRVVVVLTVLVSASALALVLFRTTLPDDGIDVVRPGALNVADGAVGTWSLDSATVRITAEGGLVITERGDITMWAADPGAAFVTGARGHVAWQEHRGYFWPDVQIRDRLDAQSIEQVSATDDEVVISGQLSGDGDPAAYTLTIERQPRFGVVMDLAADGVDAVSLVSGRTDHAGVHGFGEQFTDFDLDGRLLPIVVREQGVGRGTEPLTFLADTTNHGAGGTEEMTYAAWSAYVTRDNRSFRLDPTLEESHAFAVADMRDPGQVGLQVWAPRLRAEVIGSVNATGAIARHQGEAGPALADWTQTGAIIGLQGGTEKVRREVAELRAAGAEISAVWLQDWTGQRTTSFGERLWWTWQLDTARYPDWDGLVADLAADGIRTTTYVNPFLVDAAPKGDSAIRTLYAEARDAGFLVTTADGSPYLLDQGGFDAALVDLTDPDARGWFAQVIADEVLGAGVDGFMADFGEGLPMDGVLADGDPALAHNQWPLLWSQTVREACELAQKPDCVTWFRSGALGQAQEAALFWNGDQLVDFGAEDGLASALLGTFSAGVSGWPLVHSDIGGYTSINALVRNYVRPDDLLQRWAEYAAFGVVMRTHEGNRPAENAQVYDSVESERAFARMTRVFAALAPYRASLLADAAELGLPAIRHGWLAYPGTLAADVDTQFFLGHHILVAPVLAPGADTVEVTFPPGTWVHLFTGQEYAGDRVTTVGAPLGTPAAFVRADDARAADLLAAVQGAVAD
ncbi:alpha-glucosidase [Nocardioides sp. AE5]|uniref:alpha-glucosidase n=1 Tax=Nocardioides sp. AE5 TaxID=2962573 RepID=UPI002881C24F|nr:alpha-glucosidase [Nocardioides sp. AE5]MDT0200524.1 alpha-glucosidase [Nocardioides sp. AE5]